MTCGGQASVKNSSRIALGSRGDGLCALARLARRGPAPRIGPADELEASVVMLDQRRAALHPVAAIVVGDAEIVVHRGAVDVAADHAVDRALPRLARERLLELADEVDGVLDLSFAQAESDQ